MKLQTGVRVEAELWRAYRVVCGRERLRPSQPIEGFLRLVVDGDSAVGLLNFVRGAVKSRSEGYDAYARVLLDWFTHGKFWLDVSGEDVSVESLLLETLKSVADSELRRRIEEALIAKQRETYLKQKRTEKQSDNGSKGTGEAATADASKDVGSEEANDEKVDEILEKLKKLKRL
jgi:hypothetical protein